METAEHAQAAIIFAVPYLQVPEHHKADTLGHNGLEDSTSPIFPRKATPSMVTVFQELVPTFSGKT